MLGHSAKFKDFYDMNSDTILGYSVEKVIHLSENYIALTIVNQADTYTALCNIEGEKRINSMILRNHLALYYCGMALYRQ